MTNPVISRGEARVSLGQRLRFALAVAAVAALAFSFWPRNPGASFFFEVTIRSSLPGFAQLYYDVGTGLNEHHSSRIQIEGGAREIRCRFPLPAGIYSSFRFDPTDRGNNSMTLSAARIVERDGRVYRAIVPSEFKAVSEIEGLSANDQQVTFTTAATGHDPILAVDLGGPVALKSFGQPSFRTFLRRFLIGFVVTAALVGGSASFLLREVIRVRSFVSRWKQRGMPWGKPHPFFYRARTVLFALLAYSPAFLTLRLIGRYGVDLPVADDWTLVPFLLKAHQHSLSFLDFFTQHNEHRYVFPKLLLLVLAPLTSGSIKAEMFCSVILALLASGGVWYLLCRTVETSFDKKLLLLGLVNLLLFSPVQAGNWTWGCQFVLFLVNVWLLAGIAVAVSALSLRAKFLSCIVIAVVATFTFGGGAVMWGVIFPVALLYETRAKVMQRCWWMAAWLFACAVTMTGYLFHYVKPSIHPPLAASHNPIDYFRYISTFLGAHLSKAGPDESIVFPAILGTILMVGYLVGTLWTMRSPDAAFKRKMLPWLGVGAYAVTNAALAALTRIGFGVNQGLDSRYTTFSLYISISVIGMFAVVATKIQSEAKVESTVTIHLKWLMAVSLTVLLGAHLYASVWGISLFKAVQRHRLHGKAAFLFTNVLDPEPAHTSYLLVDAAGARESTNSLNRAGFIHPPLVQTPELWKLDSRPQPAGFLESVSMEGQICTASGWAVIPRGGRAADAVLLAYDDPTRGPIAFALTVPVTARPYVTQLLHDDRFELSGWSCEFERSKVAPGDHRITAWAFDAETNVLYPLSTPQIIH